VYTTRDYGITYLFHFSAINWSCFSVVGRYFTPDTVLRDLSATNVGHEIISALPDITQKPKIYVVCLSVV